LPAEMFGAKLTGLSSAASSGLQRINKYQHTKAHNRRLFTKYFSRNV